MFTVSDTVDRAQLEAAIPRAIEQAAREMVEPTWGEFAGLPAIERLAAEAGSWPEAVEDWQWCARFAYQVIERRGTGGGAFRLMYSRFLEEAGRARGAAGRRGGRALDRAGSGVPRGERERRAGRGLWREVDAAADRVARPRGALEVADRRGRALRDAFGYGAREPGEVGEPVAGVLLVVEARAAGLAFEAAERGEVGIAEELADDQAAVRLEHTADLSQGAGGVGDLPQHGGEDDGVDRGVLEGQRGRVALGRDQVRQAPLARRAHHVVEELLLQVEELEPALRADPLGQVQAVVAGADADLQQALAGLGPSTARRRSRVMIGCGASTQKRWP